ncbi:MAG: 50S ribosomal protein L29 [Tepidiphilus sp.]|uniref:Large ribosomal subunit protein uL29 n=1 Tax=Tepidiphilus baoligensis TaxID=2698687 RepID=A0ABX1QH91_9PROT|nr:MULTISPECIES: 50S ribosomal protein L29 [Tepidiphilus]MDD2408638.1 50S ribosomal protein L29 [Tepidiphilus sp.]MDD3432292.1 50S ribosomal protein L29 [Tepidiphilus sp.]NMH15543.1 50S ribosomal protein L29 [Tepidiphilus baoligensis]
MKAKDMREKSVDELEKELLELRKAQFSLRMQQATQQLTNTAAMRATRRDIARIKTLLREKGVRK